MHALLEFSVDFSLDQRQTQWRKLILAAHPDSYEHYQYNLAELELELIQTQMAQKPVLRAELYAHEMRASQNRKKKVRREKEV